MFDPVAINPAIFARWPIWSGSFHDCHNAARIRRYLRMFGPTGSVFVDETTGLNFCRLGQVLHDGEILAAVHRLSGGPGYEVQMEPIARATGGVGFERGQPGG